MVENPRNDSADATAERVSGAASRGIMSLLSDRGVPANEVVVTRAEQRGMGERAEWVVSVLRGRERASHGISPELVDKVLARGPCDEWYSELRKLLEKVGVAFPD